MKNTELRIGNYLHVHGLDRLVVVRTIFKTHFTCEDLDGVCFEESFRINYQSIPLTEEWLLKLGSKVIETGFDMHEIICVMQYDRFKLIWKDAYKYWYVVDATEGTYLTKIEFVHEWQNFVLVMNGKELKIT